MRFYLYNLLLCDMLQFKHLKCNRVQIFNTVVNVFLFVFL